MKRTVAIVVLAGAMLVGCGTHQRRLSGDVGPLGGTATPTATPSPHVKLTWGPFTYNSQGGNGVNSLTIAAPGNWGQPTKTLSRYDWWDPSQTMLFRLDFSVPSGSAIGNWQSESTDFGKTHPGYKSLGITNVTCPQGAVDCAEWQFSFPQNGVTRRVIDRGIVVNNDFAFAIYVSGPASQYSQTSQMFEHVLASIQLSD
jgi:hypothetical protein